MKIERRDIILDILNIIFDNNKSAVYTAFGLIMTNDALFNLVTNNEFEDDNIAFAVVFKTIFLEFMNAN